MHQLKTAAVIPARLASTRFPEKVIAGLGGKPIIQWVWERTCQSKAGQVLIATDSEKVLQIAESFGAKAVMTSPDHPSGSDRIWEAAKGLECDVIINVQGDEPFMKPEVIDALIDVMAGDDKPDMATVVVPSTREEIASNPNLPKVVVGADGSALYSAVPRSRFCAPAEPICRSTVTGASMPTAAPRLNVLFPCRKALLKNAKNSNSSARWKTA